MTELETICRAKMYMDKLAQGIDPITGAEIPQDSVLNNVRLARCFFYVSDILQGVIESSGMVDQNPKEKRKFRITQQQLAKVRPSASAVKITQFTQLVYAAAEDQNMKLPSVVKITDWLLYKGFLKKETDSDGKNRRVPTEAGRSIGIYARRMQGRDGEYQAVFYNTEAQQFLLDNFREIMQRR